MEIKEYLKKANESLYVYIGIVASGVIILFLSIIIFFQYNELKILAIGDFILAWLLIIYGLLKWKEKKEASDQ